MFVIIAYDVSTETKEGRRRLRKVAQHCLDFGQRVQKSVFEFSISEEQLLILKDRLLREMNPEEDSLRIYRILEPHQKHIEHYGKGETIDFDQPLIL